MITLYHGSNVAIDTIDLSKGMKDKDFGKGFYLTDIRSQAEEMAKRRTRIVGFGVPTITEFTFDDGVAFQLERFHEQLIDDETLARELTYKKLNRQYFFGTEKAISKLKKL